MRSGGQRFLTVAGHDEHGKPALAWQAIDPPPLFFQPTPAPISWTSITSNGTQLSILDPANGFFVGRFEIDNDGSGPKNGDPDHQDELSVRNPDGTFADASAVPFVALPPWMMRKFGAPPPRCSAAASRCLTS